MYYLPFEVLAFFALRFWGRVERDGASGMAESHPGSGSGELIAQHNTAYGNTEQQTHFCSTMRAIHDQVFAFS